MTARDEMNRVRRRLEDPDRWTATVEQWGRFSYAIRITNGIVQHGPDGDPYLAWGTRAHAERRAARLLARHRRRVVRDAQRYRERTVLR